MSFQLGESESNNLDLLDRIQILEEQIENLQSQNDIQDQNANIEETIKTKDQAIEKVTKEKDQLQQDMNKMVRLYILFKKKLL